MVRRSTVRRPDGIVLVCNFAEPLSFYVTKKSSNFAVSTAEQQSAVCSPVEIQRHLICTFFQTYQPEIKLQELFSFLARIA